MTTALAPLSTEPRPSASGAARAELLKLTSLTSIRWAALISIAAGAVGAMVQSAGSHDAASALLGSVVFGTAVVAVIGAIAGSSEYATKTIQPSLMAVPHRLAFLGAKAVVVAGVGAVLSLISALLGLVVTGASLSAAVILPVLACGLYGAAMGAFAVFFSMVVRGAAGSVAGILGIVILVPGLLGAVKLGESFYVSDLTMSEAGGGLVVAGDAGSVATSLVILLAWLAAGAAAAALRLTRADA